MPLLQRPKACAGHGWWHQQSAQWQPVQGLFLVCSGALVNEQTVMVAPHESTNLGEVTMIKISDLKIILGKYEWDDHWDEKTIQSLQISAIVLQPN